MTLPATLPFTLGSPEATVLTLEAALFDGIISSGSWLNGEVTDGNAIVSVDYPNGLPGLESSAITGAANLDAALHFHTGAKIVFGHSMGAQIAYKWLRDYGPTSDIPAADLSFVLTGNPERKYGGAVRVASPPSQAFAAYGGPGLPEDTPYEVTDFTRQYDFWSDFPSRENPSLVATGNAGGIGNLIHLNYFSVGLSDPDNVSYTEGNVTYVWSPTRLWQPEYYRSLVEESFDRPVSFSAPSVPSTPEPEPPAAPALLEDSWRIAEAAEKLAQRRAPVPLHTEWIITIYDKLWQPVAAVGDDLMEMSGTDIRNNLPSATLKLKGDTPLAEIIMSATETLVGVTVETGGLRFPFYVDTWDWEYSDGDLTLTAHLKGIWDVLNHLIIWPSWWLPLQAQIFSHAIFLWGICTCIENMVAEQSLRIQAGINEFINNAFSLNFDIRTWFGALLQSNGNIFDMLKTPIYVVRNNPFLDTSPLIARTVRMESCGQVIADITRAYGVDCRMDLWLPGDPQPDPWADLDQPTYVFTVKDRSQVEGPTKTVADSIIRLVVDVGGSFFGNLGPLIQEIPGMEGRFISPILGLNFVQPYGILVMPESGKKGSILNCKVSGHTPKGWQHIVGGRSPKWLNDLMNATYAWIIDSISILIGFSGIPSNLMEGFLNNAFLAFQMIQDYNRRNAVGPYHPAMETFTATASSPYNIETFFAFINKLWDTRGYVSAQIVFRNGEVLTLGKDVFRGGLISLLYHGRTKLFTDYIEMVEFKISPSERDVFLQVGDGKAEEAPLAKHQRFLSGVLESINVLTLAPQS